MRTPWMILPALLLSGCIFGGGKDACWGEDEREFEDYVCNQDDADLAALSPDEVRDLALTASAPNVFFLGMLPNFAIWDEDCPKEIEEGSVTRYEGGCTDSDGNTWVGTMEARVSGYYYDGFGWEGPADCDPSKTVSHVFDGSFRMSISSFTADLKMSGDIVDEFDCTVRKEDGLAVVYRGTFRDTEEPDEDGNIWNGEGWLATAFGRVHARTDNQVIHSGICEYEAASGTTTFEAGGDEIVITYDGETDCSMDATVQWSLNGEHQGELKGVMCSAVPGAAYGAFGVWVLLLGLLRRRRTSR